MRCGRVFEQRGFAEHGDLVCGVGLAQFGPAAKAATAMTLVGYEDRLSRFVGVHRVSPRLAAGPVPLAAAGVVVPAAGWADQPRVALAADRPVSGRWCCLCGAAVNQLFDGVPERFRDRLERLKQMFHPLAEGFHRLGESVSEIATRLPG